jgi:hypothetical protein
LGWSFILAIRGGIPNWPNENLRFFACAALVGCSPAALGFAWFVCLRGAHFCVPAALAFPCFLIGLLASPLCGAGTYFSLPAAKKSRQKKAAQTASS